MRKFILSLLVCIATSMSASALDLLDLMSKELKALGAYDAYFSLVVGDSEPVTGLLAIDADKYYLLVGDMETICDGKVVYEINHGNSEVNIDIVAEKNEDIFSSPSEILGFDKSLYEAKMLEDRIFELTPKTKMMGVNNFIITLNKSNNLPLKLSYAVDGMTDKFEIIIDRISKLQPEDEVLFQYSENKVSCYEIIDFR